MAQLTVRGDGDSARFARAGKSQRKDPAVSDKDAKDISITLGPLLVGVARHFKFEWLDASSLTDSRGSPSTLPVACPPANESEAREVLRGVTFAINDLRNRSWAGLVRLRNQTMAALLLTEVFAYGILALAISASASAPAIVAGVTFFLVAATVGLLNRLFVLTQSESHIDDYGLSIARLVLVPTVSGLAGLGGVFLSALMFSSGFSSLLQPQAATSIPTIASLPDLGHIFDLQANRPGLLFAVLFGFAPVLQFRGFQDLADKYKAAIGSTELTASLSRSENRAPSQRPAM